MKQRSIHPYRDSRKLTRCICKWCLDPYWAERSDSEYCCNSHKTLACKKRNQEKRANLKKESQTIEKVYRQGYRSTKRVEQANKIPAPVVSAVDNAVNDKFFEDLNKQMETMMANSQKEIQIRNKKYVFERNAMLFTDIGSRLMECATAGFVRRVELGQIYKRLEVILDSEEVMNETAFRSRVEFLRHELSPALDQLEIDDNEINRFRVKFLPSQVLLDGIRLLSTPILFNDSAD